MRADARQAAVAYTYAWWLTGDDDAATGALRQALARPDPAGDDADVALALLQGVREHLGDAAPMCPSSELALLHDGLDVALADAAPLARVDPADAPASLAHGRLEALVETVREDFDHPERLGGLAVTNPPDTAHARQCPSCARARTLLDRGRAELREVAPVSAPAGLLATLVRHAAAATPPAVVQTPPQARAPVVVEPPAATPETQAPAPAAEEPPAATPETQAPAPAAEEPPAAPPETQAPAPAAGEPPAAPQETQAPAPAAEAPAEAEAGEAPADAPPQAPQAPEAPEVELDEAPPVDEAPPAADLDSEAVEQPDVIVLPDTAPVDLAVGEPAVTVPDDLADLREGEGVEDAEAPARRPHVPMTPGRRTAAGVLVGAGVITLSILVGVLAAPSDEGEREVAEQTEQPAIAEPSEEATQEAGPGRGNNRDEDESEGFGPPGRGRRAFAIVSAGLLLSGDDELAPSGTRVDRDEPLRIAVDYQNAQRGVSLAAIWRVDDDEDAFQRLRAIVSSRGSRHVWGVFPPEGGWPLGTHRVVITADQAVVAAVDFAVGEPV